MLSYLTKTGLIAVVAILSLLAVAVYLYFLRPSGEMPVNPPTSEAIPPPPTSISTPPKTGSVQKAAISEVTVEMLPDKFSPQTLTITAGTRARFVNKDKVDRWPASGFHPTHQICPGFDSKQSVKPGGSYSFTFNDTKQCPMHDHLNPAIRGTIIVNPK